METLIEGQKRDVKFDERLLEALPNRYLWQAAYRPSSRSDFVWRYDEDSGFQVYYYPAAIDSDPSLIVFDCGHFSTDWRYNGDLDPSDYLKFIINQITVAKYGKPKCTPPSGPPPPPRGAPFDEALD